VHVQVRVHDANTTDSHRAVLRTRVFGNAGRCPWKLRNRRWSAKRPSVREIGEAGSISLFTVKTHVNRAMAKLDAHDRAQLVVFAYQARLLQPE